MPQLCMTELFSIAGRNMAAETRPQIALNLNAVYYVGCGASVTHSSVCCWIGLNVGGNHRNTSINVCYCRLQLVESVSSCGREWRSQSCFECCGPDD
jgi:hypothetical protein